MMICHNEFIAMTSTCLKSTKSDLLTWEKWRFDWKQKLNVPKQCQLFILLVHFFFLLYTKTVCFNELYVFSHKNRCGWWYVINDLKYTHIYIRIFCFALLLHIDVDITDIDKTCKQYIKIWSRNYRTATMSNNGDDTLPRKQRKKTHNNI